MIQQPHFRSHAEQVAALGSATELDPAKFPRRYALQQARKKMQRGPSVHEKYAAERERLGPAVVEAAKTMSLREAERTLGIPRNRITRIAEEFGAEFEHHYARRAREKAEARKEWP